MTDVARFPCCSPFARSPREAASRVFGPVVVVLSALSALGCASGEIEEDRAGFGDVGSGAPDGGPPQTPGSTPVFAGDAGAGANEPVCVVGATRPCYNGPSATAEVGRCKRGSQRCEGGPNGAEWSACTGETLPGTETCDGREDENCNGTVDEGCDCREGETRPCGINRGLCRQGAQTCRNGRWSDCAGGVGPKNEVCGNGQDENCDGNVDEGCQLTVAVDRRECNAMACPPTHPYAIGCSVEMIGDSRRGCVVHQAGTGTVDFKEGEDCGSNRIVGSLLCSVTPGNGLNEQNCPITNKSQRNYRTRIGDCPR
jgi:hypothetical protein